MKKQSKNIFNEQGVIIETKNKFVQCLFDKEDYNLISNYHWFIGCRGYATTRILRDGVIKIVMMHRLILNLTDSNMCGDHINHNRLDNRRFNIRECTFNQNQKNRQPKGKSKYMGVTVYNLKDKIKYVARIIENSIQTHIGSFDNEIDAAIAYDIRAKKVHGEFANLNFK